MTEPTPLCHGPQQRAIQAMKDSIRRADARRLGGPVKPGHDTGAVYRTSWAARCTIGRGAL